MQMDSVTPGALSNAITVAFKGEEEPQLPESLRLTCEVQAHIPDVTDAGEWTADAVVTFDFPLEQQFRGQGRTVEVNRWLELDGNNIRIVDLELYPTHARLNLEQDPDNAEELQSLDFYLEDKKGNRYEKGSASGLTAMGDSYLFESPYFSDPDSLTLHITKAEWLEKGREYLEQAEKRLKENGCVWGLERTEALLCLISLSEMNLEEAERRFYEGMELSEKIRNPQTQKLLETARQKLRKRGAQLQKRFGADGFS